MGKFKILLYCWFFGWIGANSISAIYYAFIGDTNEVIKDTVATFFQVALLGLVMHFNGDLMTKDKESDK